MSHTDGSPGGGAVDHDPGASRSYNGNPRDGTEGGGSDRNRPRRRRARLTLPPEYADFKLADGRSLRDVMGDKFFGAAGNSGGGKFMSKGVRGRLRKGGSPALGTKFKTFGPDRLAAFKAMFSNARAAHPGRNFNFGVGL